MILIRKRSRHHWWQVLFIHCCLTRTDRLFPSRRAARRSQPRHGPAQVRRFTLNLRLYKFLHLLERPLIAIHFDVQIHLIFFNFDIFTSHFLRYWIVTSKFGLVPNRAKGPGRVGCDDFWKVRLRNINFGVHDSRFIFQCWHLWRNIIHIYSCMLENLG